MHMYAVSHVTRKVTVPVGSPVWLQYLLIHRVAGPIRISIALFTSVVFMPIYTRLLCQFYTSKMETGSFVSIKGVLGINIANDCLEERGPPFAFQY